MQNQYEISLQFVLQLDVDSVAPALSALDANKQVYYVVTVKASSGVLVAISIADASVVWEKKLETSVVTSLQLDDNSGVLYGMILNGTGHFMAEVELQVCVFVRACVRVCVQHHFHVVHTGKKKCSCHSEAFPLTGRPLTIG